MIKLIRGVCFYEQIRLIIFISVIVAVRLEQKTERDPKAHLSQLGTSTSSQCRVVSTFRTCLTAIQPLFTTFQWRKRPHHHLKWSALNLHVGTYSLVTLRFIYSDTSRVCEWGMTRKTSETSAGLGTPLSGNQLAFQAAKEILHLFYLRLNPPELIGTFLSANM